MTELKCCNRCGAFITCDHKGECCVECEFFDPVDMLCMAGPEKKATKVEIIEEDKEIDPATFLWDDDDDDDEDDSDLPPERDVDKSKLDISDDDDW